MACPFCYVPFTGRPPSKEKFLATVRTCAEFGADVITFGGGDPFQYDFLRDGVELAADLGVICHIDTNGIAFAEKDRTWVSEAVALVGLPIDGSTLGMNKRMRGSSRSFARLPLILDALASSRVTLKLNTVVSRINLHDIDSIFDWITQYKVDIWSLYQFIPLERGRSNQARFFLSDEEFETAVLSLRGRQMPFHFEPGSKEERLHSYLFVTPDGMAYTHSNIDGPQYLKLGQLGHPETAKRYAALNSQTLRSKAAARYRSEQAAAGQPATPPRVRD